MTSTVPEDGGIVVLDRTGTVLPLVPRALERLGLEDAYRDAGPASAFSPRSPRADVLLLGPRELTPAGLRRVVRVKDAHPFTAVVALLPTEGGPSRAELRAAGVTVSVRGVLSPARIARALDLAYKELDHFAEAAGSLRETHEEVEVDEDPELTEVGVEDTEPDAEIADAEIVEPTSEPELPPGALLPVQRDNDTVVGSPLGAGGLPAWNKPGLVLTVASATGGCGKTFFATNLAALCARAGRRALLVDLDLQFGEVAAALRVRHPYSVYDGLYDAQGRALPEGELEAHLHELVCPHPLGFDVLTAPRDPELADYVGARDATRVLDAVIPRYEVVVVDTPPSLNEVVLTALDRSDVVAVLATLDVPSLKNLTVFLDTLRRLHIDDSRLKLLLNKVEDDIGISVQQAQEAFDGRFVGDIPLARSVSRAINAGTVVVDLEPKSSVTQRLIASTGAVLPAEFMPAIPGLTRGSGAGKRGLRGRVGSLFRRRQQAALPRS